MDFEVCYRVTNDCFYFHFESKKSFTHNVNNNCFVLWIYYNNDDMVNINDEINIINDFAGEYKLGKKGWKTVANIQVFKASQYEIFDNVVAIIFSPK